MEGLMATQLTEMTSDDFSHLAVDLDPQDRERKKAQRAYRLNVLQMPLLRLFGFGLVLLGVFLHNLISYALVFVAQFRAPHPHCGHLYFALLAAPVPVVYESKTIRCRGLLSGSGHLRLDGGCLFFGWRKKLVFLYPDDACCRSGEHEL